jgi:hypothetical protein
MKRAQKVETHVKQQLKNQIIAAAEQRESRLQQQQQDFGRSTIHLHRHCQRPHEVAEDTAS